MRIQPTPLHCTRCRHEWVGELIVEAPVKVCTAVMRELQCPACYAGARHVAFGRGDVPDPQPVVSDMSDQERRAAWLRMNDSGLSSRCIADVMCGSVSTGDYPRDGDDFGRCERLLMLYPARRLRMVEMVTVSPEWAVLVGRWADIAETWRHDEELLRVKGRKARRDEFLCYDLMQEILGPIETGHSDEHA